MITRRSFISATAALVPAASGAVFIPPVRQDGLLTLADRHYPPGMVARSLGEVAMLYERPVVESDLDALFSLARQHLSQPGRTLAAAVSQASHLLLTFAAHEAGASMSEVRLPTSWGGSPIILAIAQS